MSSPNERREGRASSIHPKGDRHLEVAELGEREVIAVVLVHGWCCAAVHRLIGDCSQCRRAKQSRAFELGTGWRRGAESQMRSIRRRRARVPPPASLPPLVSCNRHVGRSTEYLLLTFNLFAPPRKPSKKMFATHEIPSEALEALSPRNRGCIERLRAHQPEEVDLFVHLHHLPVIQVLMPPQAPNILLRNWQRSSSCSTRKPANCVCS